MPGALERIRPDASLADVGGDHRAPVAASTVALPPGAAQRSATRSPGCGADGLRHPLAREVLHVAVVALGDRRGLFITSRTSRWSSAPRSAVEAVDDPVGIAEARGVVGPDDGRLGHPAEHGVHQPARRLGRDLDRLPHCRVRRHREEVELVRAEAQGVADAEVELAGEEAVDEEVAGPPHARGAVDELGGEVPVAGLERRALEQLREQRGWRRRRRARCGRGHRAASVPGGERHVPSGSPGCQRAPLAHAAGIHAALALGLHLDELHLAVGGRARAGRPRREARASARP